MLSVRGLLHPVLSFNIEHSTFHIQHFASHLRGAAINAIISRTARSSPTSAARATIEVIEEEHLRVNADTVGAHFRARLEELQQKHPLVGDVRGKGLMQGLELVKDRATKEPAPQETNQLLERTRENGLLIGKGGLYGNVVRLSPMLNISKGDVDEAIGLLDKSFSEIRM